MELGATYDHVTHVDKSTVCVCVCVSHRIFGWQGGSSSDFIAVVHLFLANAPSYTMYNARLTLRLAADEMATRTLLATFDASQSYANNV